MPRKIRDLIKDLRKAGFQHVPGGKGSHRKFEANQGRTVMIIPGRDGDDAKTYLERQVKQKIEETKP